MRRRFPIDFLFANGPARVSAADVNRGSAGVRDGFFLVNDLFAGGPAPL